MQLCIESVEEFTVRIGAIMNTRMLSFPAFVSVAVLFPHQSYPVIGNPNRFFPAEKDSKPVSQLMMLEYNFNLF